MPAANGVAAVAGARAEVPAEAWVGAEAEPQAGHGADHLQKRALVMCPGVRRDHGAVRHATIHAVAAYPRIG